MIAFYESLTGMQKFYAACALLGGLLFIFRTILLFTGLGEMHDMDGDVGDAGGDSDASFSVLSLQTLTAFFMMFGLVALALAKQAGLANAWAVPGGVAAGLFTVWVIGQIFSGMKKLQSDGTMRIENAVGEEGEVYLTVTPGKTGQVRVAVQGQLRIFDASTEGDVVLPTGERIRVVRVSGNSLLIVEKA
jgi:membrane protein implicated in regulation of membrane protease activity